ncbi:ABC transporter substrate-binding protein [Pseudonocardia nigra]|uniref:ABC transporter substrate-binding protein n=1 Tax=Pseudonocardia nigra TaxID=1921578 RepID=UPI001C601CBF|nr:ABC transporter substrate-binding protein [Pseudonocardia nigra]
MSQRISRRTLLARTAQLAGASAVAGIGGGLVAGCSGEQPVAPTATQPSGAPVRGGHLRVGVWSEQAGLNPILDTFTAVGSSYAATVYDALFTVAEDGSVIPDLARSLEHSEDYTTWTIGLRDGVAFHDGSAFDAQAVAAQMEAALASPTFAASFANVAGVRTADPMTVVLTTKTPWVPFDRYLTGTFATIVTPDTWNGTSPKPIGTGPFMVEEWENGNRFVAVRNPNYWRQGLPHLDQVTFRPILNSTQRENSVKAGDLELGTTGSTISNLKALRDDSGLLYYDDAGIDVIQPHHVFWQLNCMAPPLDDVRIRKALALALDQRRFYDTVFREASSATGWGEYQPVTSFFHPDSEHWSETGYPTAPDVELAKRLVAECTAEKGRAAFLVTATNEPTQQLALSLTKGMWEPLGIDVAVQQIDVGRLIATSSAASSRRRSWTSSRPPIPTRTTCTGARRRSGRSARPG